MLEEKIKNLNGKFWTKENEMVQDVEKHQMYVAETTWEYVIVADNDSDEEAIMYLGHTNNTMWIEKVVFVED